MSWQDKENIKMLFDTKELHKHAFNGLIEEIQLETYIHYGITRATMTINEAKWCGVKINNRSKTKPDREKLFRSITGVHQWAFKLMELTWSTENGATMGCPGIYSRINNGKRIIVDGQIYDEKTPFDAEKHFNG